MPEEERRRRRPAGNENERNSGIAKGFTHRLAIKVTSFIKGNSRQDKGASHHKKVEWTQKDAMETEGHRS
jgi:hypothetical protein